MGGITALEDAAQQGVVKQGPATYGYYRQPNGWITVSPMTQLDELKYRQEGWEPLAQYGRVEMASEYMADHPLEPLFMRGGAVELCREQIVESGLHLDPPLVPRCGRPLGQFHKSHNETCWKGAEPVFFPQLEEVPATFPCRFCDRVLPIEKAREQHEGVAHKDEKGDIRTGQTLADALVKGLRGAEVPEEDAADAPREPYLCGLCGDGFKGHMQLARHVKEHKENADDEAEA